MKEIAPYLLAVFFGYCFIALIYQYIPKARLPIKVIAHTAIVVFALAVVLIGIFRFGFLGALFGIGFAWITIIVSYIKFFDNGSNA